jgi:PAS domain S-box-containing protein
MAIRLQRQRAGLDGVLLVAASLVTIAAAVSGRADGWLDDHAFTLLTIPVALACVRFGLRGGVASAFAASLLASVWWAREGEPGGALWLISQVATYVVLAVMLGWLIDSRARLLRRLAHHNEISLDLMATASFDGYFTYVNPSFTRTLGFTAEELTSRPLLEFVHPDDREPTLTEIARQTVEGRSVFQFQNRYRTRDGSYRWLEWTSLPDPQANELVAAARDVTERKRLEQLAQENTRLLEQAVAERTRELQERNAELEAARLEILKRLALAAEYRDDDTHEHTERIGSAVELLARQLGWSKSEAQLLRDAAPLHDIGKLAVPDRILRKPGKLTPEEFELVKTHVKAGVSILSGSGSQVLRLAEEIAAGHHEWWDGTGYPYGLAGEEIALPARIVAVVDVFDALTHVRPYKPAWPVEDAMAEMRRLRGRQFDPTVFDAFERLDHVQLAGPQPPQRRLEIVRAS